MRKKWPYSSTGVKGARLLCKKGKKKKKKEFSTYLSIYASNRSNYNFLNEYKTITNSNRIL